MHTTRRIKFWLLLFALLIPSAVTVALVGVIFGDDDTYERYWPVIYPLQTFVTLAIPYILAKRLTARRVSDTIGTRVVKHSPGEREAL